MLRIISGGALSHRCLFTSTCCTSLMNMFSLLILGPFVEKLYGSAKFVVFWVVTGIAGRVASYLALRPSLAHRLFGSFHLQSVDVPSAGASGALFGLGWRAFCVWYQVSARTAGRIQARVSAPGCCRSSSSTCSSVLLDAVLSVMLRISAGLFSGAALALFVDYRRPGAARQHYDRRGEFCRCLRWR